MILRCIWKKNIQEYLESTEKEEPGGHLEQPDTKTFPKALLLKHRGTLYQHLSRQINEIEGPELDSRTYGYLVSDTSSILNRWAK